MDSQFLTPKEVAEILGVHQKTVHHWLRTGKLNGTKISYRTWRIPRSAIEDLVRQNSNSMQSHNVSPAPQTAEKTVAPPNNLTTNTITPEDSCSKMKHYIRDILGEEPGVSHDSNKTG
ncbi:MAG: helix-turn-helix domain-containing protein [Methanoregula sp.]|nr:helix-turn-helix domain-containing protein [Methanoregula sp.]